VGQFAAVKQAGHRYQAAVISLGLNDALPDPWVAFAREPDAHFDRFLTAVGPVPVLWLSPPDRCGSRNPAMAGAVRAALARAATRFLNVRVLDGNDFYCAPGRLRDGVHPNELGYVALANLVRDELARSFGVQR
jgi:lysophospholipase L1-like esterase